MANMLRIATAWAGDSRMVLGRQRSNEDGQSFLEAVELTEDHKPDNPGECRRINEAGGRVDRLVSGTAGHTIQQSCSIWVAAVAIVFCCSLFPQKPLAALMNL